MACFSDMLELPVIGSEVHKCGAAMWVWPVVEKCKSTCMVDANNV